GAAGDHAGTFRGRLHVDLGGAVVRLDHVPQGAVVEFDAGHAAAGLLHRLLDRDRHLAGLAVAEADAAVAVADHGQRGEGELAAALDRLADAADRDQLLDHAVVDLLAVAIAVASPRCTFVCLVFLSGLGMYGSRGRLELWVSCLELGGSELQATLAGGIGQRLDAAVVTVAGAVERAPLDAGGFRLLGDRAADLGGGVDVLAVLQALAHVGLGGAGRGQDL